MKATNRVIEDVPNWSALLTELLEKVSRSCCTIEDFIAFRGACTSWRAAAATKYASVTKVPLLMLAEKEGTNEREFYSLVKRKVCMKILLPDAMGKRCMDVGFGWILTHASNGDVCLMKPFSSARIQLPNFKEFPDYHKFKVNSDFSFIRRAWLTANPSETLQFTLLVDGNKYLGFWRSGDEGWILGRRFHSALTYWKGKIYVLDLEGHLLVWDAQDQDFREPPGLVVPVRNAPTKIPTTLKDYLVGSSDGDQLLLIRRNNITGDEYADTGADHFGVFKVDLVRGELVEVNGLSKYAVFLGENTPVCVDATEFSGVLKPNCIYFTDDLVGAYTHNETWRKGGGKDMGIYNVEDGSIQRFDVDSLSFICPPIWIFPSF